MLTRYYLSVDFDGTRRFVIHRMEPPSQISVSQHPRSGKTRKPARNKNVQSGTELSPSVDLGKYVVNIFPRGDRFMSKGACRPAIGRIKTATNAIRLKSLHHRCRCLAPRIRMTIQGGGSGFKKNDMPPGPELSGSQDDDIPF